MINEIVLLPILAGNPALPLTDMKIRDNSHSNTFGMVRNNGTRAHQGWDLEAKLGEPVYAIAPYTDVTYGYHDDYGYWVQYRSTKSGYYYFNAHLSKIPPLPEKGSVGDVIGFAGRSGNARGTSVHLHFEMRTVKKPGLGLKGRVTPATTFGSWKLYLTKP
jgi:murein DD-endopeptidase MepM/ murein hydrolase activator NlpD